MVLLGGAEMKDCAYLEALFKKYVEIVGQNEGVDLLYRQDWSEAE